MEAEIAANADLLAILAVALFPIIPNGIALAGYSAIRWFKTTRL